MVGSQFHPEFRSRPDRPQPLFRDFVAAAVHLRAGPRRGLIEPAEREARSRADASTSAEADVPS